LYDDPDSDVVGCLSDACDNHNEAAGTEFESDSESGSESDELSDDTKED
jgi:hypothetical protein